MADVRVNARRPRFPRKVPWIPQPKRDLTTPEGRVMQKLDYEGVDKPGRGAEISIRKLREGLGLTPSAGAAILAVTEAVLINYESKPPEYDRAFTHHAMEAYVVWAACAHVSRDELAQLGQVAS